MSFQTIRSGESLPASITLVRFLARMFPQMRNQMARMRCLVIAQLTLEQILSRMLRPHVVGQTGAIRKCFGTVGTREIPLARVLDHVEG